MSKETRRQTLQILEAFSTAQEQVVRASYEIGKLIAEKVECTILGIEVMQCGNCDNPREPGRRCSCGGI